MDVKEAEKKRSLRNEKLKACLHYLLKPVQTLLGAGSARLHLKRFSRSGFGSKLPED